jgi:anti-anti-sigma regulatory factor
MSAATSTTVRLPATIDITAVAEQRGQLGAALAGAAVALDGGAVGRIDTAGVQLLAAFVAEAARRGVDLAWVAVSDTLAGNARRLGLAAALRLEGSTP